MNAGDIISYPELCLHEGYSVQRGMNFKVKNNVTVVLMSVRKGAPYADRVEEDGRVLIYEGHDVPKNLTRHPKLADQQLVNPNGKYTENGKFFQAAVAFKERISSAELVRVYEKIKKGIWAFNGVFELVDAWQESDGDRNVYKYKLVITDYSVEQADIRMMAKANIEHNRIIPTSVKLEVWKRDQGKCVTCGSTDNLHFDHILPYAKGGTSLEAKNIQLLCVRHNLEKRDKII